MWLSVTHFDVGCLFVLVTKHVFQKYLITDVSREGEMREFLATRLMSFITPVS